MRNAFLVLRALLFAAGFVSLWVWIAVSIQPLDARLAWRIAPWLQPAGIPIAVVGALLDAWCIATFITRGRGTPAPFDPPREFVASGPYRFVRNPMYIGAAWVILGAGLALGSPSIVLLAGVFLVLAHFLVVLYEERTLERRFGQGYRRYRATVNRWLPRKPRPA